MYWLEFKNDEEFPAKFGSISGGSALKFGIYYRNETQAWMSGRPTKQQEITLEEAIEQARKHRDQLVRGAELVHNLPADGTDEDYKVLQESMNAEAPDVGDLAWGHKYFSLLYPHKLDDYHNENYGRYHLIKLLQVPPETEGRYAAAGRYVAIANDLGIPLNNLTAILNERDGNPHKYWRIGTTDRNQPRNKWPLMRDGGFVAIGWAELGDLSVYTSDQKTSEPIKQMMAEKYYSGSPQTAGRKGSLPFRQADIGTGFGSALRRQDGFGGWQSRRRIHVRPDFGLPPPPLRRVALPGGVDATPPRRTSDHGTSAKELSREPSGDGATDSRCVARSPTERSKERNLCCPPPQRLTRSHPIDT